LTEHRVADHKRDNPRFVRSGRSPYAAVSTPAPSERLPHRPRPDSTPVPP
jgi:hypothetical protein